MFHLSYLAYALAGFYAVVAAVTINRLRKPTCRICVFRQVCPQRRQSATDLDRPRCYEHGQRQMKRPTKVLLKSPM